MNYIQLYQYPDLKGDTVIIKEDNPDLTSVNFRKKAQSLEVVGDPWIVYSDNDYGNQGTFECFREGKYNSLFSWDKKISSVRLVKGGLKQPRIAVYEIKNYDGKSASLDKAEESLKKHGFDMASSHVVDRGAWVLCSEENFLGEKMITLVGDKVLDYSEIDWKHKVSSLKPVPVNANDK